MPATSFKMPAIVQRNIKGALEENGQNRLSGSTSMAIGAALPRYHRIELRKDYGEAASGRSISPREFIFQCVFGNVSSQLKQSRRPPAIMRRSDSSSRERPSCILKANSCYWKKAILGWCRKAHGTLTRLSKPLLQLKRPAHLRRCTVARNNHLRQVAALRTSMV